MLEKLIIVRYGEIGVKSPKVRGRFERRLIENIKTVIEDKIGKNLHLSSGSKQNPRISSKNCGNSFIQSCSCYPY